jgi:glutamate/tyrosine decarboxylase-like PLP-dependent enzyme
VAQFGGPLPEEGSGTLEALRELAAGASELATRASGPRYFHFVTGGVTPAALGADWLASTIDQNAFSWVNSPLATRLEAVCIDWLKELFGLPPIWGGVLTTGATMANFTALAAATRWCGRQQGVDVDEQGLAALGRFRVLSSGYIHSSAVKALAMLGVGRASISTFRRDSVGRLDFDGLAAALAQPDSRPTIVVANAGEVNAGDFDPIAEMVQVAHQHSAWVHVDGAFGLFSRLTPRAATLAAGAEAADSVIADAHKWLNVPYDCGFAFVRDPALLGATFHGGAPYLPSPDDRHTTFGYLGPEMSRRARSLAVWATLRAYGRGVYRAMVERHLDLAQRLARAVDAAPDLERLAEVPLNIVSFRYRPTDVAEEALDELNLRVGQAVLADGRVAFGTTRYGDKVAMRPAIVNWRTRESDIDLIVQVVREVGARTLAPAHREPAP